MLLYASTTFLSAFLLFQIQPIIAKMILPWFGGSASVWITSMLFFQVTLLCGYLYAHWSVLRLAPRTQIIVHSLLLLLSTAFLPVGPSIVWKPAGTEDPILRILVLLTVSIGLPYFLLSTTSPLIQAWYTRRFKNALPYRLFGLSNLASLLGLLAYPVLVEPNVTLRQQSLGWSAAFAAYLALSISVAYKSRQGGNASPCDAPSITESVSDCRPPGLREQILWVLLATCASMLLLSVTNHLTQNVASIPFLWVLPLSLYLLTFILVFDYERLYNRTLFIWLLEIALGGMAYGLAKWNLSTSLRLVIPTFSAGMFIGCMFFHGELVKRKPAPQYLTSFYLMLALGGAMGGLLIGLLAPNVLPAYFELPITLIFCAMILLLVVEYRRSSLVLAVSWMAATAVIVTSGYYISAYGQSARVMKRNFYGGLRVNEYGVGTSNEIRMLVHGTVTHGIQYMAPDRRHELISYYGPESGVWLAAHALRRSTPLRVGIIGLGAGSLAAYAKPGDLFRFYEINPLVETLARSEFTYLADCRGTADVVLGDGRLSLEREPNQRFDLLVVDAFSGDAIPVHLLTRQALELYFRHLLPSGILALHITNSHLDLEPVVEKLSSSLGKQALLVSTASDAKHRIYRSIWALLKSKPFTSSRIVNAARSLKPQSDLRVWTDDYNNLFQILK